MSTEAAEMIAQAIRTHSLVMFLCTILHAIFLMLIAFTLDMNLSDRLNRLNRFKE